MTICLSSCDSEHFTFSCFLVNKSRTNLDIQVTLKKQGFELAPFLRRFFSTVDTMVLHDVWLI